jgi:hypothetical protein
MTAARSSPTGPLESAQTQLNDSCVGSLSRSLAPFNTARGFSGKDAERSNRSLCPIKRRDARVASPHNTQRAAWSHPVPGNTHICPRRRVVPCREERRVFRLSLAALPSELGKGEEHTQSVLSQEDGGQTCWLRHIVAASCVRVPTRTSSRSSTLQARLGTESESHAPRLLAGPRSRCSSIESELGRRSIAKAVVRDE